MGTVVIYKSKSGFTRTYAEWIAEELEADIIDASNQSVTVDTLKKYDTIIYGGGLYAGGINGFKLIKNNVDSLKGKKLIAFACGSARHTDKTDKHVLKVNFKNGLDQKIKYFYMRGGFNYNSIGAFDKFLMNLMKFRIKLKRVKSSDDRGLLASFERPVDFTSKKNIVALVKYAKQN